MEAESEKTRGLWKKMEHIDHRILYWLLIVVIAVPYLRPLGLPVPLTEYTKSFYKTVSEFPMDSVLIIDISAGPSGYGELAGSASALMEYLTNIYPEKHEGSRLKIIVLSFSAVGPIMYDDYFKPKFEKAGYKYGAEYVYFGFVPGTETSIARLADDIPSLLRTDYLGNNIEDLPIMEGIKDHTNINAVITCDTLGAASWWAKHWATRGVKVGNLCVGMNIPLYTTLYRSGDLFGFTGSARGGAELEYIIEKPGEAIATTDTISLSHIYMIILIIIGNIAFFKLKFSSHKRNEVINHG